MAKKLRVLGEMDDFPMGKISKNIEQANEESSKNVILPRCKNCSSENIAKVIPLTIMGNMILYECKDCEEREYFISE